VRIMMSDRYNIHIHILHRFMMYLCFSMSTDGDTSNTTGDLFVVELDVDYPLTCGTVKICNNHFITIVYRTIELSPPEVSFRLSFTSGITSNVQLVFESINETINTNTSSTPTTSKTLLFIFITGAVCLMRVWVCLERKRKIIDISTSVF
jgi:hypothetical protein